MTPGHPGFDRERFREGDPALFRRLVREVSPRMLALIRCYVSDDDQADELLQESWVRIYRKRARFSGRGSFDPEVVDRLIDAVQRGGSDHARHLAKSAGSEAEAEVVRLVAAIREIGAAGASIAESQVDRITGALQEESSTASWLLRWDREIASLATGVGSGATLWYGLTQLDRVVFSAPANRGAALLVALCGALVSLLLFVRASSRGKLPSE